MRKQLVNFNTRTDEHEHVDTEIEKVLKEGWNPCIFSMEALSQYLYTEVAYGFLCCRTKVILAKQKKARRKHAKT